MNKKDLPMEGEGSYEGATRYDEAAEKFAHSGKVQKAAEDARAALDTSEEPLLHEADDEAKEHAAEEDPALYETMSVPEDPHPDCLEHGGKKA